MADPVMACVGGMHASGMRLVNIFLRHIYRVLQCREEQRTMKKAMR